MTNTFMGFGDVATQSASVAKPNTWDKISDILTNVVKPAADIYSQVSNKPATNTQTSPYVPTSNQSTPLPLPVEEKNNTTKYLLVGGAVILVGTGLYFATRKSRNKK